MISIIGMIHVRALPGTPCCTSFFDLKKLIDIACEEASIYVKYGLQGICIENMFDRPYINSNALPGPEITAVMTRICSEVRRVAPNIPCGVQILAGLNHQALAVAQAAELQFIRAEGYIFSHIADEGLMIDACAGPLLRYRKQIDAENVMIFCDIKKKHSSHSITADLDLKETAQAAKFFLSDGIIITGKETGNVPEEEHLQQAKQIENIPLLVGSGVNDSNIQLMIDHKINAAIIGSHFKIDGKWFNDIDEKRVENFMNKWNQIYTSK
ncbi:hypothetical protein NH340_JMT03513 [Sarcoptes scabiei]|nr:hypothetical protein NH340_JMT03513 [Sarcoptes scabiei]